MRGISRCSHYDWPGSDRRRIEFAVANEDVTRFDADVVALKFAQAFYGADLVVADQLGLYDLDFVQSLTVKGNYKLLPTYQRIRARRVLFLSVDELYRFEYGKIRTFAADVLRILASETPHTQHLAMTIHGVGYGLDEIESLRSLLAGYLDAFDRGDFPPALQKISIVEYKVDRALRLQAALEEALPGCAVEISAFNHSSGPSGPIERSLYTTNVGQHSSSKPHVFVIMPFADEWLDTYYFGIESAVHDNGLLCERSDLLSYAGDAVERLKGRIETASYVIAEITTPNPNVYLEIGYAWGRDRPTILLTRNAEKMPFDVRTQNMIVYEQIYELKKKLTQQLQSLLSNDHQ